ncbi:MAG: hypothetical protein CME68_07315 [Halobacteriovoraceae bacterium]|nr:hypothetical protein [Halobacteriovoraceae bacterium]
MNIAFKLREQAELRPKKKAVLFPKKRSSVDKKYEYKYESLTFEELEDLSNLYGFILQKEGITKNTKVLLFLRPSLDFTALTFALFKIGAIPVLIDPGMGKKNLMHSISQVKPEALIAVQEVHFIKQFFSDSFKSCKIFINSGNLQLPQTKTLNKLKEKWVDAFLKSPFFKIEKSQPEDKAAILFTSGGTGIPKGVVYTHKIFSSQLSMLQEMFKLSHDEVDLPGFPLFSLFTIGIGMTSCIPDMNPSKPSQCDPEKLVQNILDNKATFVAGSPAIWERVVDYCLDNNKTLPSIKYLVMFGAPVSTVLHEKFEKVLSNGTTYTPYGATESLPLCQFSGKEILQQTASLSKRGKGTCVGLPVKGISLKIIPITEKEIPLLNQTTILPPYEIGEIIVSGDVVTAEYYQMKEQTKKAKIIDEKGHLWHRMGDVGYLDQGGKLWFCGRKTHRVQVDLAQKGIKKKTELYSIPCEAVFNEHPEVKRTALIQTKEKGLDTASIVIERTDKKRLRGSKKHLFEKEILLIAKRFEHTSSIKKIYYHKSFPVDVRHNIKIDRIKLREVSSKKAFI